MHFSDSESHIFVFPKTVSLTLHWLRALAAPVIARPTMIRDRSSPCAMIRDIVSTGIPYSLMIPESTSTREWYQSNPVPPRAPESSSLGPVYCPRVMLREVQISAAIPHCHCCTNIIDNLPRCHTLGCNAMFNSSHADVTWNKTQFLQKAISVCQMCQSVAKYFATFNEFLKCSTSSIFKYTIIMISNCSAKQCARLAS